MALKQPRDYAIEAAKKRPKMQDCKRCGQRVWGGYFEVSWVYFDPVNLSPAEEARLIAQGRHTFEAWLVYGQWTIEYRDLMQIQLEKKRGYRRTVLVQHKCEGVRQ